MGSSPHRLDQAHRSTIKLRTPQHLLDRPARAAPKTSTPRAGRSPPKFHKTLLLSVSFLESERAHVQMHLNDKRCLPTTATIQNNPTQAIWTPDSELLSLTTRPENLELKMISTFGCFTRLQTWQCDREFTCSPLHHSIALYGN